MDSFCCSNSRVWATIMRVCRWASDNTRRALKEGLRGYCRAPCSQHANTLGPHGPPDEAFLWQGRRDSNPQHPVLETVGAGVPDASRCGSPQTPCVMRLLGVPCLVHPAESCCSLPQTGGWSNQEATGIEEACPMEPGPQGPGFADLVPVLVATLGLEPGTNAL